MLSATLIHRLIVLATIGLLVTWPAEVTAKAKGDLLRQSMASIALLSKQLSQRKAEATAIRDALSKRLADIQAEVLRIVQENGIKTEAQALAHPRIAFDLMLLAEIRAYMERYAHKISYYRVACDRLSYLYQQADDDLKIVNTLSDLKIDALTLQAEKILDRYLVDAQTIVIAPDGLRIEPPEKTWETLISEMPALIE